MRWMVLVMLVTACEKVETQSTGSGAKPVDAAMALTKLDAAVVVRVAPDAYVGAEDDVAWANMLTSDGPDHRIVRTGADLGPEISAVQNRGKDIATRSGSKPNLRISVTEKLTFDETTLFPESVLQKIRTTYWSGLERCYRAELERKPSLRGKLTLELVVSATGRAVKPKASGIAEACIVDLMESWMFPIPKDKDGEPTTAGFKLVFMLTAS